MRPLALALAFVVLACAPALARQEACPVPAPNLAGGNADGIKLPMGLNPLALSPTAPMIYPVLASDGRIHLAYSVLVTNVTPMPVNLRGIVPVDPDRSNAVLGPDKVTSNEDAEVTAKFRLIPTGRPADWVTALGAGQSGILFFDITLPEGAKPPARVAHHITAKMTDPAGKITDVDTIGADLPVSCTPAIVLGPPLNGAGWFDGDGCCQEIAGHRGALNPVNGALRPAEQFAIDFVQLDAQGKMFAGAADQKSSYPYYAADILAAGAGRVIEVTRDAPDTPLGGQPPSPSAESAAGNHVIIDMGQGRYAMYAHFAPDSIAVKVGDEVKRGQRLGALGNSGNSDAPHLHFQVMDSPSSLDAVGLPFVFEGMTVTGRVSSPYSAVDKGFTQGNALTVNPVISAPAGPSMPRTMDVMRFD